MDGDIADGASRGRPGDPGDGPAFAGIDHVGVLVRDIAVALPLYLERLGARVLAEETLEAVGVRLVYVDAGNALIQLVQPTRPGALSDELEANGEGLHHVCLAVSDIPAALTRLAPGQDVAVVLGGRGRRACFLPDRPHGLRVELTELEPWVVRQARVDGAPGTAKEVGA